MDKAVDKYIAKQKSPQKEILKKLRKLFLKTIPGIKEEMKWGVVAFGGGKFYIVALKERVHVGFAIKGLSKDETAMLEGSGKTMRHIKIPSLKAIDEKKLTKLIKLVHKKAKCGC
jgi:hypothetical protein